MPCSQWTQPAGKARSSAKACDGALPEHPVSEVGEDMQRDRCPLDVEHPGESRHVIGPALPCPRLGVAVVGAL
jgi:hypothetical protein